MRPDPFPLDASLLAIGGEAHGRRGRWGQYADPDGYVRVPVIRPPVFLRTVDEIPELDTPPTYKIERVLLPGWLVPFWAAVHVPFAGATPGIEPGFGMARGDVLPGSRYGIVEDLYAIAAGVYSSRIVGPVRVWRRGDWLPTIRPRDVPLDSELADLLAAGITLDMWRAGIRPEHVTSENGLSGPQK